MKSSNIQHINIIKYQLTGRVLGLVDRLLGFCYKHVFFFVGCNATGYEYDQSAKLCVKNYKIGFTWQEAKLFCAYDSGNLVSVNNEETRDFVYEVAEC